MDKLKIFGQKNVIVALVVVVVGLICLAVPSTYVQNL